MTTFKKALNSLLSVLKPFRQIIWFLILFLVFDILWKLAVRQGDDESILLVLGSDWTHYTHEFSLWTAKMTHWVVYSLFGYTDFKIDGITIFFENSLHVNVIWGCTGLKQLFLFTFIMIFYFGPVKKKLWFLPLSLIILVLVNIFRLAFICIIIKDPYPDWFIGFNQWYTGHIWEDTKECYWLFYKDWFNLFHRDVFTWLYYDGVIFVLWLLWEEKINKRFRRRKIRKATA